MKEKKRLSILLGVLVVIAILSFWPSSGGSRPAPPARPAPRDSSGRSASKTPRASVDELPTMIPDPGPGERPEKVVRNVFTFPSPTPPPTPTPLPPTPTPVPRMGEARFIGPIPTAPPPTATPIVPPPIPYKVSGIFGAPGNMIVALEDKGRLINAREGDVLDGRFIVLKINRESIDFAFVNLPKEITRRLPISR